MACSGTALIFFTFYRICACISRTSWQEFNLQKWVAAYTRNIVSFWRLSPRRRDWMLWNTQQRPLVFETYLASYCTRANVPTYYRCIGIFWLHESSRHHLFPEVGRPWHYWQITINAASDNWSATNSIANILHSHRWNLVRIIRVIIISKFLT
jgi:hypothetical protein